jgi:protein phosphatase 1L
MATSEHAYNAGQPGINGEPATEPEASRRRVVPSPVRDMREEEKKEPDKQSLRSGMFDRRRSRKDSAKGQKYVSPTAADEDKESAKERRKIRLRRKEKKKVEVGEENLDPYDSDPGQSYRQHCALATGIGYRSCMGVPGFLKNSRSKVEEESVLTSPPSPLASEMGDLFGQLPASLPTNAALVKYSLRSSITDGSERQPAGQSVMERRELRPNMVHLNVSHWTDPGGRPYMEDRYVVENMDAVQVEVSPVAVKAESQDVEVLYGPKKSKRVTMPLTFCGVFDGHGGDKASQFCSDWMSSYVRSGASYPYDLGYAMKNAFTAADKDFVNTGQPDGTTACAVSIVGGRRVVCANAGDSRAIVVRRDGSIVRLSRDHKPGIPDETRRISELGGRVIYWGRWRVEGLLAVSRSIGDASLKPYITAEPEICEYDIGKDDWFLVISTDGVWDVMDNEEAAHVVIASSCAMEDGKLHIDTDRFKWAARNLAEHAKSCGSQDNFSVLVVDLKSCGNPAATAGRYMP